MTGRSLLRWLNTSKRMPMRHSGKRPLSLECLEDRTMPTAISWTGLGGDASWLTATNWSSHTVPTSSDQVTISNASVAIGSAAAAQSLDLEGGTLTDNAPLNVGALTLNGTLTGSGVLTVTGATTWLANGVMDGTGTTFLQGASSLTGNTFGSITGSRIVDNTGTATIVAGSSFVFSGTPVFDNQAGGTLNFAAGASMGSFFAQTGSMLDNEGVINFNGPGTSSVAVPTNNDGGTINVNQASVNLTGLTNSGSVVGTGGSLNAGSSLTNSGSIAYTGGSITASSNFSNSGTIAVSGSGATLNVGAGSSSGSIQLTGGASTVLTNTTFGPPFTLLSGATVTGGPLVVATFQNLTINGNVAVDTLQLTGGTVTVAAGSTLTVGTLTLQSGTLTGLGNVVVTNQWNFSGGTLSTTGNVTDNGSFAWSSGQMTGTGKTILGGTSSITGSVTLNGRELDNNGSVTESPSGSISFQGTAKWINAAGATWTIATGTPVSNFFATGMIDNQGTINASDSGGTASISVPVTNEASGTIQLNQITLTLSGLTNAGSVTGTASTLNTGSPALTNSGTIAFSGGSLNAGSGIDNTGSITVSGSGTTLTVGAGTSSGTIQLQGGASMLLNNTTFGPPFTLFDGSSVTGGALVVGTFQNLTTSINGDVSVDTLQLTGGTVTVAAGSTLTVGTLTLQSGTLTGPGNVVVTSQWNLSGGTLSTTGIVTDNGSLAWSSGQMTGTGKTILAGASSITGSVTLNGRELDNNGSVTESPSGSISFQAAAKWINEAGATWNVANGTPVSNFFATGMIDNQGTINASDSGGTASINVPVTNEASATIYLNQITLNASSLNNVGNVTGTAGNLTPGSVLTNSGAISLANGNLNAGAGLANTGMISVTGSSATFTAGPGSSSGAIQLGGGASMVLNNTTFGPPLTLLDGASVTGGPLVVNTFQNLAITGNVAIDTLQINGGTATVQASSTLTAAILMLQNGTLSGAGNVVVTTQWNFSGGTLSTTGTVTDNGGLACSGGTMGGTGTVTLNGTTSITNSVSVNGPVINNNGTLTWSQSGTINMQSGTFNNRAGAVFNITGDGSCNGNGAASAFNNAGTLEKTGGNGASTRWSVPLVNSGTFAVLAGNFMFPLPFGLPAGVTTMLSNQGAIQVGSAVSSAASLQLPATSTFPNPPFYTLNGGTLTGTGQISLSSTGGNLVIAAGATLAGTLTVHGNVENAGTVQPDVNPTPLTVTGNYTQDATGQLVIGLSGSSASGAFGKLTAGGTAHLAGPLVVVNGSFLPAFGDSYAVFQSAGARTGDFTYPPAGYVLEGYRVLTPQYDGTGRILSLLTTVGTLPTIDAIPDQTINEGQSVSYPVTVTGAQPPGPITFSLVNPPTGAMIDPTTGAFQFNPHAVPADYTIQVAISDPYAPFNPVATQSFMVHVLDVPPAVTLTGGQTQLNEGDTFSAGGFFTDPGDETWTATVDYGDGTGPQPLSLNADKTFSLNHQYVDAGNHTVIVQVYDDFEYGSATFQLNVANMPPTVGAANLQTALEGTVQIFDLGNFTDPGIHDGPWTVTVSWGDNSTPDTFQKLQEGALGSLPHTYLEEGTYPVSVSVSDKYGASGSNGFSAQVAIVPPTASVSGPSTTVRGAPGTFTLTAVSLSPIDQAAGFTFNINWGDGTPTQQVSGPSGLTLDHIFTGTGTDTATVTATDDGGGISQPATQSVSVLAVQVQNGVLVVGGTTGNDVIVLTNGSNPSTMNVILNGVLLGPYTGVTKAIVHGQDGNDVIDASLTSLPVELYGGAGNDVLTAGIGNDILDGGAGDDVLVAGPGRDILIGGTGNDVITGLGGSDILIGGTFMGTNLTVARQTALENAEAIWSSSALFATRVADLTPLFAAQVSDDGAVDVLAGIGGQDWFFAHTSGPANANDILIGVTAQDQITSI
jgi:hypothetical protein